MMARIVVVALLSMVYAPLGSVGQGAVLPFLSLQNSDGALADPGWSSNDPGIAIVAAQDETLDVISLIDPFGYAKLADVDYVDDYTIAAFLGRRGSTAYAIEITEIRRNGSRVTVDCVEWEYSGGDDVLTSPYHLVKVEKTGAWNTDIEFVLAIDGEVVLTETHFIPEIHPLYLPVIHTTDTE